MKKIIFLFLLGIPMLSISQAMIGSTESEIKAKYPDKEFTTGYTTDTHRKYISAYFDYGLFTYYFNDTNHLSDICMQIPNNVTAVNTLVQQYNGEYVITSKTSWDAYLTEGTIMHITLIYRTDDNIYVFYYQP